jgi:hypothetical protein
MFMRYILCSQGSPGSQVSPFQILLLVIGYIHSDHYHCHTTTTATATWTTWVTYIVIQFRRPQDSILVPDLIDRRRYIDRVTLQVAELEAEGIAIPLEKIGIPNPPAIPGAACSSWKILNMNIAEVDPG